MAGASPGRRPPFRRRRSAALALLAGLSLAAGLAVGRGGSDAPERPPPRPADDAALLGGSPLDERLAAAAAAVGEFAESDLGEVGVALAPVGRGHVSTGGELLSGPAWSVMKVPLVAAYLGYRADAERMPSGAEAVTARESELIADALTRSDNEAAHELFETMARDEGERAARERLERALRAGGDRTTQLTRTTVPGTDLTAFGDSIWRIEDALGWFRRFARGCVLPRPDARLVLTHLTRMTEDQRWGMPSAVGEATPIAFKGGWGPGPDLRWLVEQVAIVGQGESAFVIALMARAPVIATSREDPASYDAGQRLITRAAREAYGKVGPASRGPGAKAAGC